VYIVGEEHSVLGAFSRPHGFIVEKDLIKKLRLVCGRENLTPEISDVWEKDWEETITNCKKRFEGKLLKDSKS